MVGIARVMTACNRTSSSFSTCSRAGQSRAATCSASISWRNQHSGAVAKIAAEASSAVTYR